MEEKFRQILLSRKSYKGLSSAEASRLLEEYGLNARPVVKSKSLLKRLIHIVSEPMLLLLIITAGLYFFIGEKIESVILFFSIIPIILMQFFQEQRTDETIKALDKMAVDHCVVFRDGESLKLETKFLAQGDLVYLTAGDKIPADGFLLNSPGLLVDEAILTGESEAVAKTAAPLEENLLNEEHKLWQGTLVVQGEGFFLVTVTGLKTAYGKLGSLLEKIISKKTPLQEKIHRLVRAVAVAAILSAAAVGMILTLRDGLVAGLIGGLTMAFSLIPEEFPIVFSVFLIIGVWRMAKERVLIREMAMVEILGSATVICVDKTGTITEGNMALREAFYGGRLWDAAKGGENFKRLIETSLLSLERVAIDPIEVEAQNYASKLGIDVGDFFQSHTLLLDTSFESKTKLVHHIWQNADGACWQYTAGAPEPVLAGAILSEEEKKKAKEAYCRMAEKGLRVIAVAIRPCSPQDKISVQDLELVGFLGMSDPPRAGVKDALAVCQGAGIRVIMITGDNKLTAHNIAEAIGLKHNEELIDGNDLEQMSPETLKEAVRRCDIFTRVKPEQKYLIVDALQCLGEIVAMTGDGVNDAPALKKADIGISMGKKGTEVARAASGIVLMDDNFATIVDAVREGRRIYDNLRQAFVFLFSFHLPIVGLAFLPLLFGGPLIFLPIHVIFLELICDPAAVLGFEREKARRNLMARRPRQAKESLINTRAFLQIFIRGFAITAVSFGLYYYFGIYLGEHQLGRTLAFSSLVFAQIFLIIFSREWHQIKNNILLLVIAVITAAFILLALAWPPLRVIFHLVPLAAYQYLLVIALPFVAMAIIGRMTIGDGRKV